MPPEPPPGEADLRALAIASLKARNLVSDLIEALAHKSEFFAQRNRLRSHRLRLGDLLAGGGDLFAGGADLFGNQVRQVADRSGELLREGGKVANEGAGGTEHCKRIGQSGSTGLRFLGHRQRRYTNAVTLSGECEGQFLSASRWRWTSSWTATTGW